MDAISSSDLVALFAPWRATFAEQRDFLISLDGRVGDSDLGITMVKAFAAAEAVAAAAVGAPISKILITAGVATATRRLPPWAHSRRPASCAVARRWSGPAPWV
jgi:phosphoenolpyruvate---glycerone phosphotransferase subunit DhaL